MNLKTKALLIHYEKFRIFEPRNENIFLRKNYKINKRWGVAGDPSKSEGVGFFFEKKYASGGERLFGT